MLKYPLLNASMPLKHAVDCLHSSIYEDLVKMEQPAGPSQMVPAASGGRSLTKPKPVQSVLSLLEVIEMHK